MDPLEILKLVSLFLVIVSGIVKLWITGLPSLVVHTVFFVSELFLTIIYAVTGHAVWASIWGILTGVQLMALGKSLDGYIQENKEDKSPN